MTRPNGYLCIASPDFTPPSEERDKVLFSEIHAALDEAISRHPGGYPAVANAMGLKESGLHARVDSLLDPHKGKGGFKLGLEETQMIIHITGDGQCTRILSKHMGFDLKPLPPASRPTGSAKELLGDVVLYAGLLLAHPSSYPLTKARLETYRLVNDFVQVVSEPAFSFSVSANKMRDVRKAFMDIVVQVSEGGEPVEVMELLFQLVANARALVNMLEGRLVETRQVSI